MVFLEATDEMLLPFKECQKRGNTTWLVFKGHNRLNLTRLSEHTWSRTFCRDCTFICQSFTQSFSLPVQQSTNQSISQHLSQFVNPKSVNQATSQLGHLSTI